MRCFPQRQESDTSPSPYAYADKSTTPLLSFSPSLFFLLFFNFLERVLRRKQQQLAMNEEASQPTTSRDASSMEGDQEELMISSSSREEQEQETKRSSYRLMLPSDGYEWKKYGQKFIKNIGKFRSYFKCQRIECGAKKTAEWCPAVPSNIRVVYNGQHTHDSISSAADSEGSNSSLSARGTITNRYNLFTQVFGHDDDQPAVSNSSTSTTTHHDHAN